MLLRPCTKDDCKLLYDWFNDKTVRKNAFNNELITYDEHKKWFQKSLKSNNRKIYICEYEGKPVGQVRIDIEGDSAVISYMVDKNFRGNRIGTKIIELIENIIKEYFENIKIIKALVKEDNIISRHVFEKNKYEEYKGNGIYVFLKDVNNV